MIDKLLQRLDELDELELERQIKEMREIIEQEQGYNAPDLTKEQQALVYELLAWQDERHLPHTSADEVDLLKLARWERDWLQDWVDCWDKAALKHKWYLYNTGGGNTAWRLDLPHGMYVLITNGDLGHEITNHIEIGVYDKDDVCRRFIESKLV